MSPLDLGDKAQSKKKARRRYPWFRFYNEALHDPKVQLLKPELFKAWINVLCIASKGGGFLESVEDVAFRLGVKPKKAAQIVDKLADAGLLDRVDGGYFRPHNWEGRQYESDGSNERVAKHRAKMKRECNVSPDVASAVTETAPEQSRSEKEQKNDDDDEPPVAEAVSHVVSRAAGDLARKICEMLSQKPGVEPPGFYEAPARCQKWIDAGWSEDVILASVKQQMAKRGGDPPECIKYFEKGLADAVARHNAPLPVGTADSHAANSKEAYLEKHSVVAAIDRLFGGIYEAQGIDREVDERGTGDEDAVPCLSARSVRQL